MLDEIDKIILAQLGKNARISSHDISKILQSMNYTITDRAVRQRLARLEKNRTIIGYSTILNPEIVSEKINRTILVKFKFSKNTNDAIERLTNYLNESPFCIYSARLSGDFDWVCHFVFSSIEQYDLETNNFLNRFADLISDLRSYESKAKKSMPYVLFDEQLQHERKLAVYKVLNQIRKHDNLNDRLEATVESLVKHFHAKFARIWFVDKKTNSLILRFSAGKYKNIHGEFSKIPISSLKIGSVVKTKKPVVSNDVVHDPRIKHPEWAKKEKLKSFAGYPLIYKGKAVAVLGMFSEKVFSPTDFEILEIFSEQISKELSGFFETKEFLDKS
ncbi:MAG: GAF domain-containing protein [Thaumarchaeota archaeon]|nr:GAF domain-containing protein [Nitrososphaerota archaeon]